MDGTLSDIRTFNQTRPAAAGQMTSAWRAMDAVALHFSRVGAPMYTHEKITLGAVAKGIARLSGYRFAGEYNPKQHAAARLFFVPSDTLILDEARDLGILFPHQLYGAVVPYPFVKTKAITHQLVSGNAARPCGWSSEFAEAVHSAVMPGYTAFSSKDARMAVRRMLRLGPVRVKESLGDGGHGQTVVETIPELEALLEKLSSEIITTYGLVLEINLRRVTTRSVGLTTIGDRRLAYHGTQQSVTNNHGRSVYGGSQLICVRGGWAELDALPMDAEARLAVSQARAYDYNAAQFAGFFASRRNYDVGQGTDENGEWRSGVFEASWRSGGASTAELAALMAFVHDSSLHVVEATSVKRFGRSHRPPPGAMVHFDGYDPEEGALLRYTVITQTQRRPE
jgi:hypothetical protein